MRALICLVVVVLGCSSPVDGTSSSGGVAGEPATLDAAGQPAGAVAGSTSAAGSSVGSGGGAAAGASAGQAGAPVVAGGGSGGAGGSSVAGSEQGGSPVVVEGGAAGAAVVEMGGAGGEPSDPGAAGAAAGAGGDGPTEPACVCSTGPCCDGCQFLPKAHFCGETIRSSRCTDSGRIEHDYWNLFCSGTEALECTRWAVHTKYVVPECAAGLVCSGPAGDAECVPE